jgi:hypothetical protein
VHQIDVDSSQTLKKSISSKLPESLRALRHRNYQLFFAGQLISLIGTWMDQVAESWLVYRFFCWRLSAARWQTALIAGKFL